MLINFSNHPVNNWSISQFETAKCLYKNIIDLPFPAIDPLDEIDVLKEKAFIFIKQIVDMKPSAVHIMGELTFTFYMVKQLELLGIPCIASTTERIVTEKDNQTKITTFHFAGFRSYF